MVTYLFASCGSLAALRPWLLSLVAAETCRVSQVGCWGFRRQEGFLCWVGWGTEQPPRLGTRDKKNGDKDTKAHEPKEPPSQSPGTHGPSAPQTSARLGLHLTLFHGSHWCNEPLLCAQSW